MYKTVMAYLDNLIAWGDSLFRQDTGEAIDEAMMLYVLAANILGPRPQPVPKKGTVRPQTYANLRDDLKQFGTVVRDVEADIPFDLMPFPAERRGRRRPAGDRCAAWARRSTSACRATTSCSATGTRSPTGCSRSATASTSRASSASCALFEPPIDPALLARAAAAGLDVGAIVNGLNQPLPLVRFQLLVQKAAEICQEVKSLGNNLLSAMEKEDGEALADPARQARARRPGDGRARAVRASCRRRSSPRKACSQSLALAVQRYTYYERQLGKKADEIEKAIPELDELDTDSLAKMKFAMTEPEVAPRDDRGGHRPGPRRRRAARSSAATKRRSWPSSRTRARHRRTSSRRCKLGGAGARADPGLRRRRPASGGSAATSQFGGTNSRRSHAFAADVAEADGRSAELTRPATPRKIGSYARREQDWAFQSNLAAGEITQIFKQLRAAQIREAIAERELKNHRQQMKHAEEIEHFLNEEGTEQDGQEDQQGALHLDEARGEGAVRAVLPVRVRHRQEGRARPAARAGRPGADAILQFGYLAGKEGLLAGEKLYLDIKRMEMAYHELNQREYELTKHVSLLQVDPLALLQLRDDRPLHGAAARGAVRHGRPGHYFRRIKTVAVSIPCVTGPYASVNCTLTLLKSSIRKTPVLRDGVYAREDAEDDRFNDYFGSLQSIVTSSAQNDSGLFETNLRDERYLPFENAGRHQRVAARAAGQPEQGRSAPVRLRHDQRRHPAPPLHGARGRRPAAPGRHGACSRNASTTAQAAGSVRLFSVRHEFPTEWARFQRQEPDAGGRTPLTFTLRPEHYPFWSAGRLETTTQVRVAARGPGATLTVVDAADTSRTDVLAKDASLGLITGPLAAVRPLAGGAATGEFRVLLSEPALDDVWIAVQWGGD